MGFLQRGCMDHLNRGDSQQHKDGSRRQHQQTKPPARVRMLVGVFVHSSEFVLGRFILWQSSFAIHPCAKKLEISSAAIAPSRMMRQRVTSSLRSMMVDATSRGEAPPSTMRLMRPSSCSRTWSALVLSEAPIRLEEVAVIGIAAAVT